MGSDRSGGTPFQGWIDGMAYWASELSAGTARFGAEDRARVTTEPGPPNGYLLADGTLVDRVRFARLFQRLGTREGVGDGVNNFALPNIIGTPTIIKV